MKCRLRRIFFYQFDICLFLQENKCAVNDFVHDGERWIEKRFNRHLVKQRVSRFHFMNVFMRIYLEQNWTFGVAKAAWLARESDSNFTILSSPFELCSLKIELGIKQIVDSVMMPWSCIWMQQVVSRRRLTSIHKIEAEQRRYRHCNKWIYFPCCLWCQINEMTDIEAVRWPSWIKAEAARKRPNRIDKWFVLLMGKFRQQSVLREFIRYIWIWIWRSLPVVFANG